MRRLTFRIDRYLLLLFGLSLLAMAPLLAPGYFYSAHDGRHSVFFVTMFDEAIRSGALWPRWAMHHNQGYGYPTFVVQAPLAFYLAELFVLLGAGVTNAVKLAWAIGFLASAWGMYALVKTWLLGSLQPSGNTGSPGHPRTIHYASLCAVAAGLLYSYAPYHLLDMYVRAAFAETLMMAWFPWVFLAFDRLIIQGNERGWQGRLPAAALSYAGLLLTHVFALIAFTPLLTAFILFRLWTTWRCESPTGSDTATQTNQTDAPPSRHQLARLVRRTALAASAGIAGLLLAAVFLVPLFAEGPLLVQDVWTQDTYHYTRHWVYWGQFLSPFWGYGYSDDPTGANDSMGFQLGLMLVLPALIGGYLLLARRDPLPGETGLYLLMRFLLLASLVVLAVVTPGAAALWRSVPTLEVIQFPWRLLALTAFLLSALGGLTVWQVAQGVNLLPQSADDGGVLVMALLICAAGWAYSRPAALQPVEPWREDGRAVMQFEQEHPDMFGLTRFVEQRFTESPLTAQYLAAFDTPADFSPDSLERLAIIAGDGEVVGHYGQGHAFGGAVRMATPGVVQIRLFEFPGWQVRLDGQPVGHRVSPPYGLIEVDVPAGEHRIDVWMGSTPARTAGAAASGITLLALAGLWLSSRIWGPRQINGITS